MVMRKVMSTCCLSLINETWALCCAGILDMSLTRCTSASRAGMALSTSSLTCPSHLPTSYYSDDALLDTVPGELHTGQALRKRLSALLRSPGFQTIVSSYVSWFQDDKKGSEFLRRLLLTSVDISSTVSARAASRTFSSKGSLRSIFSLNAQHKCWPKRSW